MQYYLQLASNCTGLVHIDGSADVCRHFLSVDVIPGSFQYARRLTRLSYHGPRHCLTILNLTCSTYQLNTEMPFPQSNGQSFYLTNDRNTSPFVHAILEPSSRTWQYIVADPSTRRGVIIDPVSSRDDTGERVSPNASDDIIRLVEKHGYCIDHIFETESSTEPKLTAAWSLRMHFSNTQTYPPQLCSNSFVGTLQRTFARKYGAANGFSTTLSDQYVDKASFVVGRMRVTVMQVPGFRTPNRRAYLIHGSLFGAYSLAMPPQESATWAFQAAEPVLSEAKEDEERRTLWQSMTRVLSLPPETCVYMEEAYPGTEMANWCSVEHCRAFNPYIALTENEFIIRRKGELREQNDTMSYHKRGKRSR